MENQVFQEVGLDKLTPNPSNPRKRFSGVKFDELVNSVREKGVLEPILVRPKDKGFEIVAGERRFRALSRVAEGNGGLASHSIPAMVRPLSDDDAFDIMCIENLQREDLTELEEAESFKMYIDKHGMEALQQLEERTGINQRYVRKRLAVLKLPGKTLKAWEKGELRYGHLEQLSRLDDKKMVMEYTKEIAEYRGAYSVRKLKDNIDRTAINLKNAKFNLEKAGCINCMKNSETQKDLFDMGDLKGAHCLNPKCFKQTTTNWLQANWKKTGYRKKHGTNGFRFWDSVGWDGYHEFMGKAPKRCQECDDFITLIYLDGQVHSGKVCIGNVDCFKKSKKKNEAAGSGETKGGTKTPPAWHGEFFREAFYKEQLPLKLQEIPVDHIQTARVMLFSLLKSNSDLHEWFGVKRCGKESEENDGYYCRGLTWEEIWERVSTMEYNQLKEDLKEASIQVVMQDQYAGQPRRMIADHIGISLEKEWRITEEYLNKKTIPEIRKIAEDFKLFETKEAKAFLYETLLKKRGTFSSCKKSELKRIILEGGLDLAGVVPEEVLAK